MGQGGKARFVVAGERIGRTLVGFMALGFLALVGAGIAAVWATQRSQEHADWVAHTYQVEIAIGEAGRLIEQVETTRRGYLLAPGTAGFLRAYRDATGALPGAIERLRTLTRDNPRQRGRLAVIDRQLAQRATLRAQTMALAERGDIAAARTRFQGELAIVRMQSVRGSFDAMQREERRLLQLRDAELRQSVLIFYAILAVAGLLLIGVAIASFMVVSRSTRAIAASRDQLRDLNDNLEGLVAGRTADLSRANDEIQRFAYIVSHDLRSPLVNVMGFTAELEEAAGSLRTLVDRAEEAAPDIVTSEASDAARQDLPEAIGFIRSSTQKMDRLINAILQLSRQGRRVLAAEPLDLVEIVGGIRDTLRHRLDAEDGAIDVAGTLPMVVSDRLGVEQILSNLIENAVKYADPVRPVRVVVSGEEHAGRVAIAVADNGRGIDPRDHERVFDLFRRSGTQDRPGEGIGLAHVRALAYRLGGTIGLASRLGEGATFTLSLPRTLELQERP